MGSLALRPVGTYDPLLPERRSLELPGRIGQFPGRDFNPLDIQLLLHTVRSQILTKPGFIHYLPVYSVEYGYELDYAGNN